MIQVEGPKRHIYSCASSLPPEKQFSYMETTYSVVNKQCFQETLMQINKT